MAIPFLQSISVPGLLLNGFGTGVLISTSGTVSALSGTNLVLANGSTLAQSTLLSISAVNNGDSTETLISRIRSDSTQLATLSWDGFNMIFNRSPLISTLTGGSKGMVGVSSSGALFRATAGTDYLSSTVGNAVSATKLLNARTIELSGGVTGTATSFDGTANITIPVTTVAPSFIGTGYTQNRFYIHTHPEGGGVIIPFINNDIAHLIARGGTMTSYKTSDTTFTAQTLTNIGSVAIDTTAPFDGSPSYAHVPTLVVTDKLIIDITCPAVYSYGTTVYIDFGNSGWSAKDVSFYAYNSNVNNSETLYKAFGGAVTNNQQGRYFVVASYSYVNTSAGTSQGFNKLRLVLTNFQGTSPRIATIGVVNYDSRGLVVPFMSRAGGALYGSITPQSTNTLNLGSASNLFANIYTTSAKIGTINGLLKGVSGVVSTAVAGTDYVIPTDLANYQPLDGDLTAIATLVGTSGLARKTAANTWSLDTATYLTANQTITLSGIITGSGTTAITTAIADAALSIAKTSGLQAALDAKMDTTSYPDLVAIEALAGTAGLARKTAANTWSLDTATYLTANQTITLSGIITGSGTTAITTAIADAALSIAKTSGLQTALDAKMSTASYPDLVAIEALAGTTGLARKTAANTWSLDTATYLTANQTVTLSGIITGSGTTAITTAIADDALSIAKTSGLQTALDTKMMKISASSAAASVANTTTTTAILSTSLIAANQAPGTLMDITCEGTMRFATLSDTITFTLLLGSVTLGTFTIVGTDITGSAINTDYHYKLTGRLSPQTGPGASSNVGFYGVFTVMGTTASTVVDIAVIGTAINTTVSNNVIINVAWSAAATNNSITTNYTLVGKLA